MENNPALWLQDLPVKGHNSNKYDSGHAVIYGAPELTGATRLAVEACARMGSGLVTVLSKPHCADIFKASLPAHIMVRDDLDWWGNRVTAVLYGPGGLPEPVMIHDDLPMVLDADALAHLPSNLHDGIVLTPHEGEFAKAFPDVKGSREERAQEAAKECGAIIVLKGAQTIIAHPDGRVVLSRHASPNLATAGTGDVLAGMITGLLAQGMEPFKAACAAVWIHGECARIFGAGLVASDLPGLIPGVLNDLILKNS
jgi:hydroxyethylthiazole kinase-like uncharacterized protein yjeF